MKKQTIILFVCLLSALAAMAQGTTARITLTVTDGSSTHTMPVNTFSYDFNKYDEDTLHPAPTKTVMVMISCKSVPSFIYQAASGTMSHKVSVVLTCYGEDGKKQKVLQLSNAVINELSEPFGDKEADMGDKTIVIRADEMKIDAIKL